LTDSNCPDALRPQYRLHWYVVERDLPRLARRLDRLLPPQTWDCSTWSPQARTRF
jgi:hypothetical protein